MSTTQQAMPQGDADALVHRKLYVPVFFTKLAKDWGIRARNPAEADRMLAMATQLRAGHDQEQVKSAAADDFLLRAQTHLEQVLGNSGLDIPTANDTLVKAAAVEVAQDPEIARAILSLQLAAGSAA